MIKLYKFGPAFGLPDASPFVMKVETYLRMTGQKYEAIHGDPRKSPRGQMPYVDLDGKIIPDSAVIVETLEAARPQKLDAHLTPADRAVAVAFRSMLEEHLYFGVLYLRWLTDDGWSVFEPTLREMLGNFGVPGFMRGMISKSARKQVVTRTSRQGLGRQPRSEVVPRCLELIDSLAEWMGDKPYACGDRPTTFDATTYAFTAGLLCKAFDNETYKHTLKKKNLVAYEERLRTQYWKD
jgi:glutathione S-transferase